MAEYIILGVRRYGFRNDRGELVEGIKMTYLDTPEQGDNAKGYTPLTITAPIELWRDFEVVPGFYDVDFRQRPDSRGKPVLVLDSVKFKKPVQIEGKAVQGAGK